MLTDPTQWYIFGSKSEADEFAARFAHIPKKRPFPVGGKPAGAGLQGCLSRQWQTKSTGVGAANNGNSLKGLAAKPKKKFAPMVPRKSALTAKI